MKLLRDARRVRLLGAILLGFAAGCVIGPPAKAGETYALLVGVHNYSEEKVLHPLAYAEADVSDLAQVLRDGGLAPENVVLMTQAAAADDPRFMPERKRILKELALLLAGRSDQDTVLVAFAGHGVHFRDDKNSYFCPADAQLDDRSTLIPLAEVYAQLEGCKAGVKVLLADCCRNDPFQDKSRAARIDLESVTRPELPEPPKGVAAFFSCSEREKAYEADKLGHGVFFHYVIEGLKGEAAPDKEQVSLLDLGAYVTGHVSDFVRSEYGAVQQPELAGRSSGSAALLHIDRASLLYRQAEEALDAQDFDKAVERLTSALKINPKFADAYAQRGRAYNGKQVFDKAVADCDAALALNPDSASAYWERAVAHAALHDPDKAIDDYSECVRLDPNDAVAFSSRGNLYADKGDYDKAIDDYTEAVRINPKDAVAFSNRGSVWNDKQEYDKAIADCDEAVRIDPNYAVAFQYRGCAYQAKGDLDRAVADFTEAIRLDPKNTFVLNSRGNAYADSGDYEKAIADYTEAVRLDSKDAVAFYNRASACRDKGDPDRAIDDYTEAIRLNPKYAVAYHDRGNIWSDKQQYDQAVADYTQAIRVDPKYEAAWAARGNAWHFKQEYDKAIADYTEAIRLNPEDSYAFNGRGLAYQAKGDNDAAKADFDKSDELNGMK